MDGGCGRTSRGRAKGSMRGGEPRAWEWWEGGRRRSLPVRRRADIKRRDDGKGRWCKPVPSSFTSPKEGTGNDREIKKDGIGRGGYQRCFVVLDCPTCVDAVSDDERATSSAPTHSCAANCPNAFPLWSDLSRRRSPRRSPDIFSSPVVGPAAFDLLPMGPVAAAGPSKKIL